MSDPLDELRAAWRRLEPPAAEGDSADPLTRATVEWMRAAWRAVEAPPAAIPVRRARRWRLVPLAAGAAAGWLALVGWLAFLRPGGAVRTPAAAPFDPLPTVHAHFRADGAVELVSGNVRLVLVDVAEPSSEPREPGEVR